VLTPQLLALDLVLVLFVLDQSHKGVFAQEGDAISLSIDDVFSERELSLLVAQQVEVRLRFALCHILLQPVLNGFLGCYFIPDKLDECPCTVG
jgi:hypothetical protein